MSVISFFEEKNYEKVLDEMTNILKTHHYKEINNNISFLMKNFNPEFQSMMKSNYYLMNLLFCYELGYLTFSSQVLKEFKFKNVNNLTDCLIFLRDKIEIPSGNHKNKLSIILEKNKKMNVSLLKSLNFALKKFRENYLIKKIDVNIFKKTYFGDNVLLDIILNNCDLNFETNFKTIIKNYQQPINNMIIYNPEYKNKHINYLTILSLRLNVYQDYEKQDINVLYDMVLGKHPLDYPLAEELYIVKKDKLEKVKIPFGSIEDSIKLLDNINFEERENLFNIYQTYTKTKNIYLLTNTINKMGLREPSNLSLMLVKDKFKDNLIPLSYLVVNEI